MKSEQILESLSRLDPENKDHWTQNGQPLLSAVGEGVTRGQIIEAAPLFSRDNPVLSKTEVLPELTDKQVQETLDDKLLELSMRREEASQALTKAHALRTEAEKMAKAATAELESLTVEQKALDPRTDAEINRDLLKSSFAERLRQAGAQQQARQLLNQAGLVSELRAMTSSPVDRAIAERIVRERRNKPTLKQ